MDARTRERLPVLPALAAAVDRGRKDAAARLDVARAAPPGEQFAAGGQTLRRARLARTTRTSRIWAEEPGSGKRHDLIREEDNAFWSWAAVEVLRHTGIRLEELTELSHHSLVQYRPPSTGELVPLLSVAPSKTDQERLLVIDPELADTLSAIITRVRSSDGAIPLVASYDTHECTWNPPMPLLFQRVIGLENRPGPRRRNPRPPPRRARRVRHHRHRRQAPGLRATRLQKGLHHRRHPERDAAHIAQLILGHDDINTTMGYKAVYPEEVIRGHRAFIARRRELRPSEEYRTPTDTEWEEFLGHFERRRVALGDCGRAYSTSCIHEHSCIRCPLLRIDPAQRGRSPTFATTSWLASPKQNAKAGPAKQKDSRSASPPRTASSPKPTPPPLAAPRPSTSASPPTATSPPQPFPSGESRRDHRRPDRRPPGLRRRPLPLETGTELLISNGTFLHRRLHQQAHRARH